MAQYYCPIEVHDVDPFGTNLEPSERLFLHVAISRFFTSCFPTLYLTGTSPE